MGLLRVVVERWWELWERRVSSIWGFEVKVAKVQLGKESMGRVKVLWRSLSFKRGREGGGGLLWVRMGGM